MGKSLKGKELGSGISQKPNGRYRARTNGKFRKEKEFDKLSDAKKWKMEEDFKNEGLVEDDMTVDAWFDTWLENIVKAKNRKSTYDNYNGYYKLHMKPIIGHMKIVLVKPMHCQKVLNKMARDGAADSHIKVIRVVMHNMFKCAVENQIIKENPVNSSVGAKGRENANPRRALTVEETDIFLDMIEGKRHEDFIVLCLYTGMRAGELSVLQWKDVNFDDMSIRVDKTISSFGKNKSIKPPKTKAGIRTIPMSLKVYEVLKKRKSRLDPESEEDYLFTQRNGDLFNYEVVYGYLERLCKKNGFRRVGLHELRHTFATRCIEQGMNPKALQNLLGHSEISTTLDIYVEIQKSFLNDEFYGVFPHPMGENGGNFKILCPKMA